MNLNEMTAHELHSMLVGKKISAVELTQSVLDQIDRNEKTIGAYISITRDSALESARAVDQKISRGEELGVLGGIPCAIKDNICTKGITTTCASKILENFVPPYDATVMTKLRAVDPIIIGKANMDEFAMGGSTENSGFHVTRNPRDVERVPGGSSGGSAAAVAADEAICALGSDTGGAP